ncbi:hypothetical protein B296_00034596 [Ensete ventricosum]|uniref:Uncharacterized protein n=1 Tax=Ensete ventricosum TaxID=4639 RepID=A0A427A5L3_ENSVE|nr:hypothetical protein B296_00034596 [Ensete ventricosum]
MTVPKRLRSFGPTDGFIDCHPHDEAVVESTYHGRLVARVGETGNVQSPHDRAPRWPNSKAARKPFTPLHSARYPAPRRAGPNTQKRGFAHISHRGFPSSAKPAGRPRKLHCTPKPPLPFLSSSLHIPLARCPIAVTGSAADFLLSLVSLCSQLRSSNSRRLFRLVPSLPRSRNRHRVRSRCILFPRSEATSFSTLYSSKRFETKKKTQQSGSGKG